MWKTPSAVTSPPLRGLTVSLALVLLTVGSMAFSTSGASAKPSSVTLVARACPNFAALPSKARSAKRTSARCNPLPDWPFTLGGEPAPSRLAGPLGVPLSVLANAVGPTILTRDQASKGRFLAGVRTILLPPSLVKASAAGQLWVQGGTPTDPVPRGGLLFATLRCTGTGDRARNVHQLSFPAGSTHILCLAYYVEAAGLSRLPRRGRAAGHPQEPQPPKVVYAEAFENGVARTPLLLSKYVGPPLLEETYNAAQRFLENCNGYIVQFESNERKKASDCEEVAFDRVRQMAWTLGKLRGTDPKANHAVSAYTDGHLTLPANSVQFETVKPIPTIANSRFITFSVDAVETNCNSSHAELKFYLLSGGSEIPTFTKPIDPCSDKNAQVIEPPELGSKAAAPFKAGIFAGNAATLFTGTSLGVRMRNGQTSESGNDAAFDNIEVLDATPALDKSFSPDLLDIGATSLLTYTITNTSELGSKSGWSFLDTLPSGLVVATPAQGSTTCPATTVTADAGGNTIAVSGSLALEMSYCTVTVGVTSAQKGTYTNGPDNISKEIGIEPPEDAKVTFVPNADLKIEKSASPNPGIPGENLTYKLKVTNLGPDTAEDVLVADPLPDGLSFVSATSPCTASGSTVVKCELGSLKKGDSVTLTVVARIPASASDGFVNTATVTSTTPDPDLSNNSDTVPTPIPPLADLEIKKSPSLKKVAPGGQVTYTLVVNNNGPNNATDVTVVDPLPTGLSAVSALPSQGKCSIALGVVCHLGAIARGGSAQILLTANVSVTASGSIENTSTVTGGQPDPNPDNNSSTAEIEVPSLTPDPLTPDPLTPQPVPQQRVSDMKIVKRVDRAATQAGRRLVYTLRVTNLGPNDAPNVRVTDTWSLTLEPLSAESSQGQCRLGRPIVCSLGTVPTGATATITIVVEVKRPGREENTASVTSANRDPDLSNNQSSVGTGVLASRAASAAPPPKVTG